MGAIVAPKRDVGQTRRAALPWVAAAISLVVHAGVVAALVADPVTPPEPLPMITLELSPGLPGSKTARQARPAAPASPASPAPARTRTQSARAAKPATPPPTSDTPLVQKKTPVPDPAPAPVKSAPSVPVARSAPVVRRTPKRALGAVPDKAPAPAVRPDPAPAATPTVKPATKKKAPPAAKTSPVKSRPVKTQPVKRATAATSKPPVAKPPAAKPPVAKRTPPRRTARKASPTRPARPRPATAPRRAAGRQVAAAPGPKDTYTPPRHGTGGGANRPPVYPHRARRLGWQGRVVVRVRVDPRGRVEAVRLGQSSGHGVLDRAALKAVRNWRFSPATRGATPVAAWVDVPVRFRLTDGS